MVPAALIGHSIPAIARAKSFAWNGAIAWWINMVVFVLYTGVFIVLLRKMIEREDFGTGVLPDLPDKREAAQSDSLEAVG